MRAGKPEFCFHGGIQASVRKTIGENWLQTSPPFGQDLPFIVVVTCAKRLAGK
jgi:hypothetical protein